MDAEKLVGKVFGDCLLQELIGVGTMGVSYRAMQSHPLRQVVVKVMTRATTLEFQQQAAFNDMFRGVMKRTEMLRHPNIVPIYGYGISDSNLAYVAMAEVQGETLEQALAARGALAVSQVAHYLEQITEALDYANERGIVHRDLKPATIFITSDEQALVADFLMSSAVTDEAIAPMRLSRPGTLDYMSPELVVGKQIDRRADIYSLGALLYHMVTGEPPFKGQTLMKVAAKHLKAAPPSPHVLRPDLPIAAEQVILKALAKNPAHRYDTALEFAHYFRQAGENTQDRRPAESPQAPRSLQRPQERTTSDFEGSDSEAIRAFTPRGLSRVSRPLKSSQAQQARESYRFQRHMLTAVSLKPDGGTTDGFSFGRKAFADQSFESPAAATDPRITIEESRRVAPGVTGTQPRLPAVAVKDKAITPVEEPVTEEPDRQAATQENTGMWKLPAPAKIVSIPVAGLPGQFVTGIFPTQPLQQKDTDAARPGRSRFQQKRFVALTSLALLVVLGSLGLWIAHGITAYPLGRAEPGQTVSSSRPGLGATATARSEAALQASTILYDPLSANIHDWPETATGTILYQFKDGAYYISNNDPSRIAPAILPGENLGQPFTYTLTMDEVRGDDTSINNEYGMIVRFTAREINGRQAISFYSFEILNKTGGQYQFWKYDNSSDTGDPWKPLAQHPLGSEFHQGLGAQNVNTVTIQANGKNFTLIVNGKNIWSVSDGSLTIGSVGMLVNLKGAEVAFSNLRLTDA